MSEREKIDAIDGRVGRISRQFRGVEDLLTALFERQMNLEALVSEQQVLLQRYQQWFVDEYGEKYPFVEQIADIQVRVDEVMEQSVK